MASAYDTQVFAVQFGEPRVVRHRCDDHCQVPVRIQIGDQRRSRHERQSGRTVVPPSPALQVTEVQQVKLSVVLRVINGVHILETTATISMVAVTCTV